MISLDSLIKHIDFCQIPREFGGSLYFDNDSWVEFRRVSRLCRKKIMPYIYLFINFRRLRALSTDCLKYSKISTTSPLRWEAQNCQLIPRLRRRQSKNIRTFTPSSHPSQLKTSNERSMHCGKKCWPLVPTKMGSHTSQRPVATNNHSNNMGHIPDLQIPI
jgi:hypothetical protein